MYANLRPVRANISYQYAGRARKQDILRSNQRRSLVAVCVPSLLERSTFTIEIPKPVEEALEQKARLLDLTNDAIMVRDASDRITFWNKSATDMYGFSREEAIGRVSHDLLRTEFPEPLEL